MEIVRRVGSLTYIIESRRPNTVFVISFMIQGDRSAS
jgi:hypothetical protein